jgi:hypothetical protein
LSARLNGRTGPATNGWLPKGCLYPGYSSSLTKSSTGTTRGASSWNGTLNLTSALKWGRNKQSVAYREVIFYPAGSSSIMPAAVLEIGT